MPTDSKSSKILIEVSDDEKLHMDARVVYWSVYKGWIKTVKYAI